MLPPATRVLTIAAALLISANVATAADWVAQSSSGYKAPGEGPKASNGLPDGHVAQFASGSVRKAWYVEPTKRYRHAILGDAIEAGGLRVELSSGKQLTLSLPRNLVFEDRTPRLVDLDNDGEAEIVTLLSAARQGAAVAVYGVTNNQLKLIDQTPFIGLANRWRNVAGMADYNGDGLIEIAEVVTPHIGGTLRFWSWKNRKLEPVTGARFFSNHAIGATEQRLSATADFNGDGVVDIAVPGGDRGSLHLMGFVADASGKRGLKEIASLRLKSSVAGAILNTSKGNKISLKLQLRDGSVWTVRKR